MKKQSQQSALDKPEDQSTMINKTPSPIRIDHKLEVRQGRPRVRNKDGVVIWEADPKKFSYCDPRTGKQCDCSWTITGGGTISVKNANGNEVEGYKLKEGETYEEV